MIKCSDSACETRVRNSIDEHTKIEFGVQANLFNSIIGYESTGDTFNETGTLVPTPNTNFDYTRDIYALYGNYNRKIDKWSYQFGLRLENVEVSALAVQVSRPLNNTTEDRFSNDYFELYPSAYITYESSKKHSFQLNYSSCISLS